VSYQNCHRLIGDAVLGEYVLILIESPKNLFGLEEGVSSCSGGSGTAFPSWSNEIDLITISGSEIIDAG